MNFWKVKIPIIGVLEKISGLLKREVLIARNNTNIVCGYNYISKSGKQEKRAATIKQSELKNYQVSRLFWSFRC